MNWVHFILFIFLDKSDNAWIYYFLLFICQAEIKYNDIMWKRKYNSNCINYTSKNEHIEKNAGSHSYNSCVLM